MTSETAIPPSTTQSMSSFALNPAKAAAQIAAPAKLHSTAMARVTTVAAMSPPSVAWLACTALRKRCDPISRSQRGTAQTRRMIEGEKIPAAEGEDVDTHHPDHEFQEFRGEKRQNGKHEEQPREELEA